MSNKYSQVDSSPEKLDRSLDYRVYTVRLATHNLKMAVETSAPEATKTATEATEASKPTITLKPGMISAAQSSVSLKQEYDLDRGTSHSYNPTHLDTAKIKPSVTPVPEIATAHREPMSAAELEQQRLLRESRRVLAEIASDETLDDAATDIREASNGTIA